MFCHSPATTTATSASRARSTARCELGLVVEPLGVLRRVAGEHVEHRREDALRRRARRARTRPVPPSPALARMPSSTVTVSSRSKSKHPRPERVALGVGQRPDHRDRAQAAGVERQQVALVAQQHRRALGRDAGHLAVRRVGEHLAGAVLVDVRVVEQPQAQLRLEHAPHARVERLLAHRARLERLGQVARRRGRRSPSPCRRPALTRAGAGVGQVGGEAVGHEVAHGVGVADDEALEAPASRAAPR